MTAFILSARTINLDGLRSSLLRKTYDVDFSHSGRKIAEKLRESKGNRVRLPLDSQRFVLASILNAP
jgi:hypothetical protein